MECHAFGWEWMTFALALGVCAGSLLTICWRMAQKRAIAVDAEESAAGEHWD